MTDPTWRRAARMHFEPAHTLPFVDQAHRMPKSEPLWVDIVVFLVGIPLIAILVLVFLGGPG